MVNNEKVSHVLWNEVQKYEKNVNNDGTVLGIKQ